MYYHSYERRSYKRMEVKQEENHEYLEYVREGPVELDVLIGYPSEELGGMFQKVDRS